MRVVTCVAAVMLMVIASAGPASAFNWSVGASLGANVVLPSNTDINGDGVKEDLPNSVEFAWPLSPAHSPAPGLRVGFAGDNPHHEFYLDTGLFLSTTKDSETNSLFTATANYQYNFSSESSVSPYVTVGGGLFSDRYKDKSVSPQFELNGMSGLVGGGVGLRHKMGNGHGVIRAEVRFDRLTESKDGDALVVPASNIVGFKLGFDLWDK